MLNSHALLQGTAHLASKAPIVLMFASRAFQRKAHVVDSVLGEPKCPNCIRHHSDSPNIVPGRRIHATLGEIIELLSRHHNSWL